MVFDTASLEMHAQPVVTDMLYAFGASDIRAAMPVREEGARRVSEASFSRRVQGCRWTAEGAA